MKKLFVFLTMIFLTTALHAEPGQRGEVDMSLNNTTKWGYLIIIDQKKDQIMFYSTGKKQMMAVYDYKKGYWIETSKSFEKKNINEDDLFLKKPVVLPPDPNRQEIDWNLNNTVQFGYLIEILKDKDNPHIRFYTTKSKKIMAIWDYQAKKWVIKDRDFKEDAVDINKFYIVKVKPVEEINWSLNNTVQFGYLIEILKDKDNPHIRFYTTKSKKIMAIWDYQAKKWVIKDRDFSEASVDINKFYVQVHKPWKRGKVKRALNNSVQFGYLIEIKPEGNPQILFYTTKSKRLMGIYDYIQDKWITRDKDFKDDGIDINQLFDPEETVIIIKPEDKKPEKEADKPELTDKKKSEQKENKPGELKPFKPKLNNHK